MKYHYNHEGRPLCGCKDMATISTQKRNKVECENCLKLLDDKLMMKFKYMRVIDDRIEETRQLLHSEAVELNKQLATDNSPARWVRVMNRDA